MSRSLGDALCACLRGESSRPKTRRQRSSGRLTERRIRGAAMSLHTSSAEPWTVADLFSCGGGTSAGFARRPEFEIVGAVDLQVAKPSGGIGSSDCNATYAANHGLAPLEEDIVTLDPQSFRDATRLGDRHLSVLISCAPCTDFTRTKPENHLVDLGRNSLVGRSVDYVESLQPDILFMENARELVSGRFNHHHRSLCERLGKLGYDVKSEVHMLSRFGLPQIRERALVVASRLGPAKTLSDLWKGWQLKDGVITVRTALARLLDWQRSHPTDSTGNVVPAMGPKVSARLRATPIDGGSWPDLARDPKLRPLLTPQCRNRWESNNIGSHPDVYGRMWWDRPAPTIKRECAHVGNGRYSHPEEDRLLTVREMATLQGFPFDYLFPARALSNRYRHVGDAVPPLIAWQMSALAKWMYLGERPEPSEWVMPKTVLRLSDLTRTS